MSRILRRPMFRGGGKVSSYGNGIASGMGYAGGGTIGGGYIQGQKMSDGRYGFSDPIPIGQTRSAIEAGRQAILNMYNVPNDAESKLGKNILKKATGLKRFIPTMSGLKGLAGTGVAGTLGASVAGAGVGAGIGQLADFYAKSTSTPEGYRRLKEMGGSKMTFDETNIDVGQDLDYIAQGNMMGEKPGFFPRGGKAKFYEDRGYNPDGTLKQILDDQTKKDPALEAAEDKSGTEITVNKEGEPILSKKERLEKSAKEYEEILGAGIKKDSIFDAMIEGGTRLYEGEGAGAAIRAANKALDPIQNIKTASRKLALEEDIAIRKALAVAKGKSNATRDLINQYEKAGLNDREIANRLSNNEVELPAIVQKMGSKPEGYKEFVRRKYPGVNILQETDPKKIDTSVLDDGRHYITYPTDAFIEVKDGKLVGKIDYR